MNTYMTTQERMNATNTPYHHVHVAAEQDGARIEPVDLQAAEQRGRHGVAGMLSAERISAPPMVALFAVREAMMPLKSPRP